MSESQIRDSQPGGPGPRIYYIPQEQGGPVIPTGTGFPFRRGATMYIPELASARG
jgi:hypothetical protein